MFVDLSGFTAVAEQLDPEDVKELAQAYVAQFSNIVADFGGNVIREFGDEVLAVFGAPVAHDDDAERAVRAALAIRDRPPNQVGGTPLQVHVGINTGEIMAGVVGGAARRDYTLHGDTVNTAARLRSAAAAGTVLVGEETYRATRRVVRYRALPPVQAKGKERPVPAWEALDVAPVSEARPLRAAPLIGRDSELAVLSDLWAKVTREARPHLVTVLGEPGIGKSRLVTEFERGRLAGALVLHGRCLPYGEVLGYWAVATALQEAAGITAEDDARQARARLESLVRNALGADAPGDEATDAARHLAFICGLDLPADRAREEEVTQHVLHASARRFLEALAREHPVCLLLEDIHWADGALLDLVEFVASRVSDAPVLIITQARPELLERRPAWGRGVPGFTSLPLDPLGKGEASELVAALFQARGLAPELVEKVGHGAGGNPLFAEELVAMLAEGGDLGGVPSALKGLISARLDRLPADERRTLQLAAVCGKVFWEGAMRALGAPGDTSIQLDALEYKTLVRAQVRSQIRGERQYLFKHDLIRDVAYQTLPRAVRRMLHGRLTDWLEQASGERVEEYLDLLAHHAVQAEQPQRGLDYLIRAAERARRAGALREQAALLAQAIAIADSLGRGRLAAELYARRGRALSRCGMFAEARAELETALAQFEPEQADARGEALIDLTWISPWLVDPNSIRRYGEEARALAKRLGRNDLVAGAEGALAFAESSDGHPRASLALFERAIGRSHGLRSEVLGPVLECSSLVLYFLGHSTRAIERAREAYVIAERAQDAATMIRALGDLGMAQTAIGDYTEALATYEEARRLAQELGVGTWLARAVAMRGGLHLDLFDFRTAEALAGEARDKARSLGFVLPIASAGIDLLLNYARRGEPGLAESLVHEVAVAVSEGAGTHGWVWRLRYAEARAELALASGDWPEALRWSGHVIDQSRASGRSKYESIGLRTQAAALARQGRARGATARLRRSVQLARKLDQPALFVGAASALLALDGDAALACEARSNVDRMMGALPDGELRQHLSAAEPVSHIIGLTNASTSDGDHLQVVAGKDDRLVV